MKKTLLLLVIFAAMLFLLCSCHKHEFGNWKTVENATCTEYGAMIGICECGEEKYEILQPIGHNYENGICKNCGANESDKPCAHANLETIAGREAGCTDDGLAEGKRCADCGEITVEQKLIPATGHTYDNNNDAICNVCGSERDVSCLHTNVEPVVGVVPTCTEIGLSDGKKCLDCGEILTAQREIKSIVHQLGQWHAFAGDKCKWCGEDIPESSEGLIFELNEDGESYTLIDASNCTDENVVISTHRGLPVTKIAAKAFPTITTTNGNTTSFSGMHFNSISIGDSVTTIEEGAFQLTYVGFLNIGSGYDYTANPTALATAFLFRIRTGDDNPSLKVEDNSLITKDGKTLVKVGWFGFDLLASPEWEIIFEAENADGIISILSNYDYDSYARDCYIPDGFVLSEGDSHSDAIKHSLDSYTTPEGVETIAGGAFFGIGIKKVILSDSVKHLDNGPFTLSLIEHLVIGDGVTEIPSGMASLSTIRTLTVGKNVNSVNVNAFGLCQSFVEIINKSDFDFDSLDWESSVARKPIVIHSDENSRITETEDGYLFIYSDTTNYLFDYTGNEVDLVLPESFKGESYEIASYAFNSNDIIQTIVVSDGVTAIHENAFNWCYRLVSVTIGKNVEYMHEDAFNGCDVMVEIVNHSNMEITPPSSVKFIHSGNRMVDIVDDYIFYVYNGNNYLIKYIGEDLHSYNLGQNDYCDLVLPESYNGENYIIAEKAFYDANRLRSIVIPSSVTEICDRAFYGCTSLTLIVIPESVTSIGGYAFYYCSSLTSVSIPNSVTSIGTYAFGYCTSLTSIVIPDSVDFIRTSAFNGCSSLTIWCETSSKPASWDSYWNPDNRPVVWGDEKYSDGLEYTLSDTSDSYVVSGIGSCVDNDIIIPNEYNNLPVTGIEDYAFWSCNNITSVVIPEGVTKIGYMAFGYCSSLTKITIPESIETIEDYALEGCSHVLIGNIYNNAYYLGNESNPYLVLYNINSTQKLTEFVINPKTRFVYSGAIIGCENLEYVIIPKSVTNIGSYAFPDASFKIIYYTGTSEEWESIKSGSGNSMLSSVPRYDYCEDQPLVYGNYWHYVDGIPVIWQNNMSYSEGLEYTLSNDGSYYIVSSIGTCTDSEITIPPYYKNIIVKEINSFAFSQTKITSLSISKSIDTIGFKCLGEDHIVEKLHVDENNPYFYSEGNCIIEKSTSTLILGCNGSIIPNGVSIIGIGAFAGSNLLTNIEIPSGVSHIQKDAFYCCKNLKTIDLSEGLISISDWAFYDCFSLESIYIPSTVESIDKYAYYFCTDSVSSITVHPNNNYYHSEGNCLIETATNTLVQGCKNSTIPNYITTISAYAFRHARSLEKIIIPKSVVVIEGRAFEDCTSLTIYCEASSQPEGWNEFWNMSDCNVIWGYTGE